MTAEGAAAPELPATPLEDWPPRPWLLALLGAVAALLIHLLVDDYEPDAARSAGAAFGFFGALSLALTVGPGRWKESAIFSGGLGLVLAGLTWHWVRVAERAAGEEFAFAAAVLASAIAVPLFQAGFQHTRFKTDYRLTHFHVWTDAITGAGAMAFTGLSWLMLLLLDQLLQLVGITLIDWLFQQEWFGMMWTGGAFGAALGVLRNNLKVIGSLQHVVLLVLSLLAVPLALALVVFLVALLASGGQALWDATDAATPILLACAVGCFVLANAIVRDDEDAITGNRMMRATGMVLAAGVLPLAGFAAVSMGIRIAQHGLTPERIWALIAVAVAVAYGLAYAVALGRGRRAAWTRMLRQANLNLAAGTCVLALLLALPLVDFGAVSARSQMARLDAGKVAVADFDFAALRWDFGDAGRRALAQLASRAGEVGEKAKEAEAQTERTYDDWVYGDRIGAGGEFTGQIIVDPIGTPIPENLRSALFDLPDGSCFGDTTCRIFFREQGRIVVVIADTCTEEQIEATMRMERATNCVLSPSTRVLRNGQWVIAELPTNPYDEPGPGESLRDLRKEREAVMQGDIRIEPQPMWRVYLGDKPIDGPFE